MDFLYQPDQVRGLTTKFERKSLLSLTSTPISSKIPDSVSTAAEAVFLVIKYTSVKFPLV